MDELPVHNTKCREQEDSEEPTDTSVDDPGYRTGESTFHAGRVE